MENKRLQEYLNQIKDLIEKTEKLLEDKLVSKHEFKIGSYAKRITDASSIHHNKGKIFKIYSITPLGFEEADGTSHLKTSCIPATKEEYDKYISKQEVELLLFQEARKRGFDKKGIRFKPIDSSNLWEQTEFYKFEYNISSDALKVWGSHQPSDEERIYKDGWLKIYQEGKWAEIIEEPKAPDLTIYGFKYEFYKNNKGIDCIRLGCQCYTLKEISDKYNQLMDVSEKIKSIEIIVDNSLYQVKVSLLQEISAYYQQLMK